MSQLNNQICPRCLDEFSLGEILEGADFLPSGILLEGDDSPEVNIHFVHVANNCGGNLKIRAGLFNCFIKEPLTDHHETGSDDCENHCSNINDLKDCHQECANAPYRRLMLKVMADKNKDKTNKNKS